MRVSVFVCTFGDVVTYAGIAQHPFRAVSKLMMDATREYPVTECGKALEPHIDGLPCPHIALLCTCSLRKALQILREYVDKHNVITDYNYSIIDDDDIMAKPYVRTVYNPPYPKHIVWGSKDARESLEEQFFTSQAPHHLLQGSLCDIMVRVFRECIVFSRSPLGHSMAYAKKNRNIIVRSTKYPYIESYPLYKFCTMAVEWLAEALEYLLSRIISGCRNEANLTFNTQKTLQAAFEAYRLIHTIEGSTTWLQSTKKACSTRVQLTQAFAKCITDYASTPESVRISFEKLRRIYPENHPDMPDFKHYKKRVFMLDGDVPTNLTLDLRLKKIKPAPQSTEEE